MAKPVKGKKKPPPARIYPDWMPASIIALIGFLLYINTWNHGYVLDDITVVSQNHIVQEGLKGIPKLLGTSYWLGYSGSTELGYRPLSLVMLAIEWQLSPANPHLNHIVNILLYALTGFILYYTLKRLLINYHVIIPFLAALLFIAHPVHTEVIANIKSRDEILSLLFSVCSLYFLTKNIIPSLIFFFLALISKENAITLFAIVPLAIYFFTDIPVKKNLRITAMFAAVIVFYIVLRLILPEGFTFRKNMPLGDNALIAAPDLMSRLATAVNILGRYLLILIIPHPLISDYSFNQIPIVKWTDAGTLASLAVYLFLIVYAVKGLKKKNPLSFAILFYLITFSVVSNILFLVGATLAERFLYLPSLGFCLAAAFLLSKLKKPMMVTSVVALCLLYSIKTIARNTDWKSNFTLFSADVQSAPNSCKLNYYYSVAIIDELQNSPSYDASRKQAVAQDAIDHLQKALTIWPDFVEAMEQLGYAYYLHGYIEKAKQTYESAKQHGSHSPKLWNNYAVAFIESDEPEKAIPMLEKAVADNPNYTEALNNLGSAYTRLGKWDKAIPPLQKAIETNPKYEVAYKNIARAYGNMHEFDTALSYLQTAERLMPNDAEIYMLRGYSYKFKGDSLASAAAFEEYNRLNQMH